MVSKGRSEGNPESWVLFNSGVLRIFSRLTFVLYNLNPHSQNPLGLGHVGLQSHIESHLIHGGPDQ